MKMNRVAFLGALKTVGAALSSNRNQLPVLSHLWFDGETVSAFDDIIGIRLAMKTDFTGGILGDKLLGVLEKSAARDVRVELEEEGIVVKLGRAHIKFALRPIEEWFWQPEPPDTAGYKVNKEFLSAIGLTLISVGTEKILSAEQRGITIMQHDAAADLYATDAVTLSWMRLPNQKGETLPARCIMPTAFCEQLKKVIQPGADLLFDKNAAYCIGEIKVGADPAEILLFSRLVEDDTQIDFQAAVKNYGKKNAAFEIPGRLKLSMDRALVMLQDGEPATFEVAEGELYVFAKTQYGIVDDVIKLSGNSHPEIKVNVDPVLLRRGLEGRVDMTVSKECVVMSGPPGFLHIVATK